jgi:hypothetical protein
MELNWRLPAAKDSARQLAEIKNADASRKIGEGRKTGGFGISN